MKKSIWGGIVSILIVLVFLSRCSRFLNKISSNVSSQNHSASKSEVKNDDSSLESMQKEVHSNSSKTPTNETINEINFELLDKSYLNRTSVFFKDMIASHIYDKRELLSYETEFQKSQKKRTKKEIRNLIKSDSQFITKNNSRFEYDVADYKTGYNNIKLYFIRVLGFKKDNLITVSCSSMSPISITSGKCSDEINKQFDIRFEEYDVPEINLH